MPQGHFTQPMPGQPTAARGAADRLLLRRCATTWPTTPGRTPTCRRPSTPTRACKDGDRRGRTRSARSRRTSSSARSPSRHSASRAIADFTRRASPTWSRPRSRRSSTPTCGPGSRTSTTACTTGARSVYGMTGGLFDPQTRRNEQNEACGEVGTGENDQARIDCEKRRQHRSTPSSSTLGAKLHDRRAAAAVHDGRAPDFVGAGHRADRRALRLHRLARRLPATRWRRRSPSSRTTSGRRSTRRVEDVFGFDPETFVELLKNPSVVPRPGAPPLNLPAPLDVLDEVGGLFAAGDHERLDAHHRLRRARAHRRAPRPRHAAGCDDDAEFSIDEFAPLAQHDHDGQAAAARRPRAQPGAGRPQRPGHRHVRAGREPDDRRPGQRTRVTG